MEKKAQTTVGPAVRFYPFDIPARSSSRPNLCPFRVPFAVDEGEVRIPEKQEIKERFRRKEKG